MQTITFPLSIHDIEFSIIIASYLLRFSSRLAPACAFQTFCTRTKSGNLFFYDDDYDKNL